MKKLIFLSLLSLWLSAGYSQQPIKLNAPDMKREISLMDAFSKRASASEWNGKNLSIQDLSDLLWSANGINRPDSKKRTAPSAINAQDIDIYVFSGDGVYLYDAENNVLNPVVTGDQRSLVAGRQPEFADAALLLVMVSDFSRFRGDDENAKKEMALMDAGIVSQNISLFCAGAGLNTRPRATMDTEKIKEVLKLKDTQHPLMNNPVSYPVKK
jgi:SagB-type dehydrogenase family enzyme